MEIQGNIFVVTGAASGLGEASAQYLIAAGGRVVGFDLEEQKRDGYEVWAIDISDEQAIAAALDRIQDEIGPIAGLVHCAAIVKPCKLVDPETGDVFPTDLFRRTIDVNLTGSFLMTREVARRMLKNSPNSDGERGVVVHTASIAGLDGSSSIAYAASKGGLISMLLTGARNLGPAGIRLMGIAPGSMETAMFAGLDDSHRARLVASNVFPKRLGDPAEFAGLMGEIIRNKYLNGTVIRLDAGTRN